ncbi:LysR family transcriptional regulator [Sphingosinicella sp. BN140058]|uniref:LysR family transcriptional regulator n=1 Tax=Sphingosinicella sp. BN140058 TaxID=1892855 RepID=UPI001012A198|nr:LysR family transcriptional regulator [Sphingosinicella sp. BN140058]QAY75384.1 LysR family transcriptional regulator [Sphingosinicella sp. BN140058]
MDRDQLPHLMLFAAVARSGGFRAAGRALNLSPSAVSHSVGALEHRLGVRLFNRTTRSLSLTNAGQRLLDRLEPALAEIDEGMREARELDGAPSGRVRITAPPSAALMLLAPHLGAFSQAYPEISLDIVVEDRFVDIVAERFDAGLRLGERLQPDMVAVRIGPAQRFTIVAAPQYLARYGRPATLEALSEHRCIQRRFSSGGTYAWEVVRDGADLTLTQMVAAITANDDQMVHQAALRGAGIAFLYQDRIADDLAAGRLIELFADHCAPFPGFSLYHPSRRQMRPAVRAFIDFFVAANRAQG